MDSKAIENFLREIIEIDNTTITEVNKIQTEITNRENQLKIIATKIEDNSEVLKATQTQRLLERLKDETDAEIEKINEEYEAQIKIMERIFDEKKAHIIERALEKLSVGRWES